MSRSVDPLGYPTEPVVSYHVYRQQVCGSFPHWSCGVRRARNFHIGKVRPALGYSREQVNGLAQTVAASGAEGVVDVNPVRLDHLIQVKIPLIRISLLSGSAQEHPWPTRLSTFAGDAEPSDVEIR